MAKLTIIGATGRVGQYAALSISRIPYVHHIQLYGRDGSLSVLDGIASDLIDSFAATGTDIKVHWSCDLSDMRGSDIVIIVAGIARRPDQDRLDLSQENARIVAHFSVNVGKYAPDAMLMIVTNPVDIMTFVALRYSGMKPGKVFGLGTHLDSMRLKSLIASHFKVHVSEVHTRIIGEHGESMVPLWSATPSEVFRSPTCRHLTTFLSMRLWTRLDLQADRSSQIKVPRSGVRVRQLQQSSGQFWEMKTGS